MESTELALLAILVTVVSLSIYFGVIVRIRVFNNPDRALSLFLAKSAGFLTFGVIPFVLFVYMAGLDPGQTGLTTGELSQHLWLTIIKVSLVVVAVYLITRIRKGLNESDQNVISPGFSSTTGVVLAGWLIYILGYEYLFRGVLWFLCFSAYGFFPALIINVLIYVIAHFGQDRKIIIGTVPFGVILCIGAHLTGSFLLPFILHGALAVSHELFAGHRLSAAGKTI